MTEIDKIIETASFNNTQRYERSDDLNTLYQQASDQERELIDTVLVMLGAEPMPKIWALVNGESE